MVRLKGHLSGLMRHGTNGACADAERSAVEVGSNLPACYIIDVIWRSKLTYIVISALQFS